MCYDFTARPPFPPISGGATDGEDMVLTARDGNRFAAYRARASRRAQASPGQRAQVLIFPDVRGLHPFYKELALRFGEIGIPALAIDYFGRTAGLAPRDETFEYQPHVEQMQLPAFLDDVRAALAFLRQEKQDGRIFVVGFCRGGTLSLLTATEDLNLSGIIAFYPGMSRSVQGSKGSTIDQARGVRYPVLGLFGGADPGIPPEHVQQLDAQLKAAGVPHNLVVYPGATHSFFDRRQAEFAEASTDAWKRLLGFIETGTP